jgi:CRISPR-associated protein Cas5d
MIVHLRIWGDIACFTRPEMNVERVSYPIITPSAARAIFESILYKPEFRWSIRRIAVKRPINFLSFRRNEVKSRLSVRNPEPIFIEEERTQRNTLALRSVEYVIEAGISLTPLASQGPVQATGPNTPEKYMLMFQRRAAKGQCFNQPYMGCREFPAHFEPAGPADMDVPAGMNADTDFGFMVYDVYDLDNIPDKTQRATISVKPSVTLYPAKLKGGIVAVPPWTDVRKQLSQSTN